MEVGGGTQTQTRRRLTLSEQMRVLDSSSNLRELMRVRDEDDLGRDSLAGLTLGAVLGCDTATTTTRRRLTSTSTSTLTRTPAAGGTQSRSPSSRTLLDIINDEESGTAYRSLIANHNNGNNSKKSWKSFKDRLRLGRAGAAWSSSSHLVSPYNISLQDCRIQISRPFPPRPSTTTRLSSFRHDPQINTTIVTNNINVDTISSPLTPNIVEESQPAVLRLSDALAAEREDRRQENGLTLPEGNNVATNMSPSSDVEISEVVAEPVRVSLMALLEETDRQAGVLGSTFSEQIEDEDFEEEEDEEEVKENGGGRGGEGVGEYACCVCMVRHKGAAFIPCGHTFCRLCSRELWVSRGNCPLCNSYILEILDIF